jgi:hypothetical protein
MDQVSKMLDHLERRDDACFVPFCQTLVDDRQHAVAAKLAGKVGLTHMLGQNATPSPAPMLVLRLCSHVTLYWTDPSSLAAGMMMTVIKSRDNSGFC